MRAAHLSALVTAAAVLTASCGASAEDYVRSPAVRMWSKGTTTEGEVTVAGEPADVYAAVTDYQKWTVIFPNLASLTVKSGDAIAATVETVSTKGKHHTLVFKNDPRARVIRFEERGGRAEVKAEISFRAGARKGETIVHARLYADVHGAASLFVSDAKIRGKREKKVMGDLARLYAYFGAPGVKKAAAGARSPAPGRGTR
jgi:carbon monoxide dehydrogenase subunit G